jgi:hypothetical protein
MCDLTVKNKFDCEFSEIDDVSENSNFQENEDENLDILNEDSKSGNFEIDLKEFEFKSDKSESDITLIQSDKTKVKSKFSIESILGLDRDPGGTGDCNEDVKCDLFVKPIPVLATALYKQYSQGEL